jgi:hypothetical protein
MTHRQQSKPGPQTLGVSQMVKLKHTILVAREQKGGKRTFRTFESLQSVRLWMRTLPDEVRNLYHVDLSAWSQGSLTDSERAYLAQFVSPLVFDVEWLSVDDQPDPLAEQRIAVLQKLVLQALKSVLPIGFQTEELFIQVEDLGRQPTGK